METVTVPVPVTATPSPAAAPAPVQPETAVPVPPKTIPGPEAALAAIKARIAAANQPKPVEAKPEPAKDPEIKPDLASLMAELVKVQNQARDYKDKVKEQEAFQAEANQHKELRELWSKDPRQAIAKLAGKDAEDAVADIVALFYADMPDTDQDQGQAKPNKTEALLLSKLEEVTKKLEAIEGARKQDTDQTSAASVKAQEDNTRAFLKAVAVKHKDQFEISNRDENVTEAVTKAMLVTTTVLDELNQAAEKAGTEKIDPSKVSAEQAETIAKLALAKVEAEYEQLGQRFGKTTPVAKPSVYDRPLTRPSISVVKAPAKETFDQYKERVRKQFEQASGL
jgi:hypothetical protein